MTEDKLVIPYFSLAGSVLSRNHGLATFVHKWLEWLLDDQFPELSETEWLRANVARYKTSSTCTNLHARNIHQRPSWRSHTPACMLATSTANMWTGVTTKHLLTEKAWTPGQHPTALDYCMTKRKQPVPSLTYATSASTQTWSSRVSARTTDCWTVVMESLDLVSVSRRVSRPVFWSWSRSRRSQVSSRSRRISVSVSSSSSRDFT